MNIDIYNKIKSGGLVMTSPAVDVGNQALSQVNQADQALEPLESLGIIDLGVLQTARSALSLSNSSLTGSVTHIASTANDSLRLSSMAQQVNKLDALSNQVPSSCFNSEAMFASVNGACDELFNQIGGVASEISKKVSDYLSGLIDASELESYLAGVGGLLQGGIDGLASKLSSETGLLKEMAEKIQASSLAQSIEALWKNECTQGVLDTTLPPDIKALL
ncbi:DUF7217 family protein [Vibrio anguillarum]|uniref:DUF7217 family protein n=1 Tax=Vibrio anguillarum TaxID=55601 RepID=UPI00188C4B68|nr:hypothetical protein [Vibrio anguillarum]MBF4249585.1 hypothetical protein [Vibrio anguillarum]MBF4306946.1 hypothetical protein [Vibrio anguillarum]